jgi:hypothetical protein
MENRSAQPSPAAKAKLQFATEAQNRKERSRDKKEASDNTKQLQKEAERWQRSPETICLELARDALTRSTVHQLEATTRTQRSRHELGQREMCLL